MAAELELLDAEAGAAPAFDIAVSRAILDAVAAGERPESLRLWRPGDALAFSIADRARPGFAAATAAAARCGFTPFLRLAGGQAAVYTSETLAFAWAIPAREPRKGIQQRFEMLSALVAAALQGLGVDARVGPVPDEYCPGDHSVNARGRAKLMGVGQRVVHGAAYLGGVIVVGESARARGALAPVYAELGLAFDPATVGSVEDEVPGASFAAVREALVGELAGRRALRWGAIDADLVSRAHQLEARFRIGAAPTARAEGAKLSVEL